MPTVGRYGVIKYAYSCFLLMFLLEKFLAVAPKPVDFPSITMEEVVLSDGSRGTRLSNTYKPRAWRWVTATQAANKSLAKVIDKGWLLFQAIFLHLWGDNKAHVNR